MIKLDKQKRDWRALIQCHIQLAEDTSCWMSNILKDLLKNCILHLKTVRYSILWILVTKIKYDQDRWWNLKLVDREYNSEVEL